ncbi:MAG TPA: MobF family relaxase [Solirubrobacterales bacterium]|nr:MobF family relaxase [Solirubrobacterales bacterium]
MLGVTKIGARSAGYWISAVRDGEEDYYTKPGEAPGYWLGSLAGELGLAGVVDADDYGAILAGQDPSTGATLVARPERRIYHDADGRERKSEPTLGYDLRFSAPKSVSLLWAVGSPEVQEIVLRVQAEAVAAGIARLEREACWVARGKGGVTLERGAGFVSMGFLHRSSRAGDPALHTHVVTSNMTRALSDGKWLSLANPKRSSPLHRDAKVAGHVFQAVMRAGITRELGLEFGEVKNGYADLLLFSRAEIEHFSQRRMEIVERLAELGVRTAAAAEVAAYQTREAKDYGVVFDNQRADWVARAAEFGIDERSIDRAVAGARARAPRPIGTDQVDAALADLEEHHSHFDRRDLLCSLASQLREGADATELERAVEGLLAGDRLVEIHRGHEPTGASYYTTPRLWEMERRIVDAAVDGADAGAARIEEATLAAVLARHDYLGDEQAAMVARLTTGGERVIAVAALPGTGKTTALKAAAEGWAAGGFRGIGLSTARSATNEIRDVGLPATSIAKFLILISERAERGLDLLPPGTVIVVDEASAMSTPHAFALLGLVERCEGKLVLIGDPRQIGAVGPGGIYAHLARRLETVELTEIRRQRSEVDREVVRLAHEGRGSDALDVLAADERLRIADGHEEALEALALDWHRAFASGSDAVMIARRNDDVARLNQMAQEFRLGRGELGEGLRVAGAEFRVGDRVMTRVNTPEVDNRERWEVIEVDRGDGSLGLRRLGGEEGGAILRPEYLRRTTPEGDPAIEHAYALTTYAAQGKTFDGSYILLDPGISSEDFLVAVSRARGETVAYGVAAIELTDAELGPGKREIVDPLHDLRHGAERVAGEYPALEVDARKRLETLGPVELARRRAELERALTDAGGPSPAAERLAALDRRISSGRERLQALAAQRSAETDPRAADRLARLERQAGSQLGRLDAEREGLAREAAAEPEPPARSSEARLELRMVEERMVQLRRMQVAAERLTTTGPLLGALGPYPDAPRLARHWDEGADLIYAHRLRYGITSPDGDPLGPRSGDAARRRERQAAQQRLERVQRQLEHERVQSAERAFEIEV